MFSAGQARSDPHSGGRRPTFQGDNPGAIERVHAHRVAIGGQIRPIERSLVSRIARGLLAQPAGQPERGHHSPRISAEARDRKSDGRPKSVADVPSDRSIGGNVVVVGNRPTVRLRRAARRRRSRVSPEPHGQVKVQCALGCLSQDSASRQPRHKLESFLPINGSANRDYHAGC